MSKSTFIFFDMRVLPVSLKYGFIPKVHMDNVSE
jgi:hypothetical protein